jgi:hypothetical protein
MLDLCYLQQYAKYFYLYLRHYQLHRFASAHDNDTVTIVATDVAGNEAEQPIIVSVKMIGLSTSVVVQVLSLALTLGRLALIV